LHKIYKSFLAVAENPTNNRDSKPEKNSDAGFGKVSEFASVFIEASQIFEFNIFFPGQPKSFKTTRACRESINIIL
jgi:hypothetical protein